MIKRIKVVLLVLLSLIALPLTAAIIATYQPAPYLAFTTMTPNYPSPADFPPFTASDFVAHLGTLTIQATNGETLYQPSLINSQISNIFQFDGPVTWYSQGNPPVPVYTNQNTGFSLVAVTSVLGTSGYQSLWGQSGTVPLTSSKNAISGSTFTAKFYFLSEQNSPIYKPGALYTLVSGSPGAFNVAVAPNNKGIYNQQSTNINVPVNGQAIPPGGGVTPESPILVPGGTPPVPYEDPENPVITVLYDFSIIENQAFSLPNGYLTSTALLAKSQLILTNSILGTTYGVDIQFSKLAGSTSFALHPTTNPSGYAIPYQLKFLGQTVIKDVSIPWTPLFEGVNIQNILITGISPTIANAAPDGSYKDTIVVTITVIE